MGKEQKGNVIGRIFRVADQGKGMLILSCTLAVIGMVAGVVPYLSVYHIARLLLMPPAGGDAAEQIWFWIIIAGISTLLHMVFSFLGSYGCHRVAFRLLYQFRVRVMEHIGQLSLGFFANHTTGGVQKTMDENIEKIEGFIAHMLPDILGSLATVIVLFGSLFFLNGWLALTVILTVIVAVGFQMVVFGGKKAQQLWQDVALAAQRMTGAFSEYVKGMAEVKLFGLAGTMTKGLADNIGLYRTWELQNYKRSAVPMSIYKTLVVSMLSILLPVGIILLGSNSSAGNFLAVLMGLIITPAIYDPLMTCVNYGAQMGQLAVGMDAVDEILELPVMTAPPQEVKPQCWDVEFRDVSFSYQSPDDEARQLALEHLSFTARQGQMTALVGPSGGGKSTVGQLLQRFWDTQGGSVCIGDVDVRTINTENLMDYIAAVFQDTYIFADTIWGNITMNRDYSQAAVDAAVEAAQCRAFIESLPQGYQTRIGTGGSKLSGGEAQRLSIARAILKDSPIVVLDEALAYSDAENENLIQKAIRNLVQNKTVIIIAHRLQSIKEADQILVLEAGRIIEQGTHQQLLRQGGEYRVLWDLQHQAEAWSINTGAAVKEETL